MPHPFRRGAAFALIAFLSPAVGCVPDIEDETSRVSSPRVLAVRAEPAEAPEGAEVAVQALIATSDDESQDAEWRLCIDRKPLRELGPVSPTCLIQTNETSAPLGTGSSVPFTIPEDSCTRFGPERPDSKPGEPTGRPVDADPTGGFYQPVVAWLGDEPALGAVRLACPLTGASRATTVEFNSRYRPNTNPAIDAVELVADSEELTEPFELRVGERVRLRVAVSQCPTESVCGDELCGPSEDRSSCPADCQTPKGCTGAETYAWYDREGRAVRNRTETLTVSWYSTQGRFREERTESEGGLAIANDWVAPATPGEARLWIVLRDDRGGVAWQSLTTVVR